MSTPVMIWFGVIVTILLLPLWSIASTLLDIWHTMQRIADTLESAAAAHEEEFGSK